MLLGEKLAVLSQNLLFLHTLNLLKMQMEHSGWKPSYQSIGTGAPVPGVRDVEWLPNTWNILHNCLKQGQLILQ